LVLVSDGVIEAVDTMGQVCSFKTVHGLRPSDNWL
jgi:hypothetical protein